LIFSHNDLLANNILITNDQNKYVFIDYEYSTYNYAIFDIANYFN
jgi:thiamine kinase-like enzyme